MGDKSANQDSLPPGVSGVTNQMAPQAFGAWLGASSAATLRIVREPALALDPMDVSDHRAQKAKVGAVGPFARSSLSHSDFLSANQKPSHKQGDVQVRHSQGLREGWSCSWQRRPDCGRGWS